MGFLQTKIQQHLHKGENYVAKFVSDDTQIIKRINPLCKCIKYKIKHPEYIFWYKTNHTANKIVVITYDDNSTDFLELQAIVNET